MIRTDARYLLTHPQIWIRITGYAREQEKISAMMKNNCTYKYYVFTLHNEFIHTWSNIITQMVPLYVPSITVCYRISVCVSETSASLLCMLTHAATYPHTHTVAHNMREFRSGDKGCSVSKLTARAVTTTDRHERDTHTRVHTHTHSHFTNP